MRLQRLQHTGAILLLGLTWPFLAYASSEQTFIHKVKQQAPHLKKRVLHLAWRAYHHGEQQNLDPQHILTIIDYSMPSSKKRLWVINMNKDHVKYHTLVAHGKGSGRLYAHHFSNHRGTHATSLGLFKTGHTYYGNDGYSLRLKGLEPHFNGKAYQRHIVMHSAWYVSQSIINKEGRLGRSWGCPALSKKVERSVVNTIKNGTLLLAYYPKKRWLQNSKYLKPLSA